MRLRTRDDLIEHEARKERALLKRWLRHRGEIENVRKLVFVKADYRDVLRATKNRRRTRCKTPIAISSD